MPRYLLVLPVFVAVFLVTAQLQAAQPDKNGPSVIKLKMGAKTLDFSHRKHQKLTDNHCWECHDKKMGKIDNWGEGTEIGRASCRERVCVPV